MLLIFDAPYFPSIPQNSEANFDAPNHELGDADSFKIRRLLPPSLNNKSIMDKLGIKSPHNWGYTGCSKL